MKVRVQPLATHLGYFLYVAMRHVFQQPPQVGAAVESPKLFLIEFSSLVHSPFVLKLKRNKVLKKLIQRSSIINITEKKVLLYQQNHLLK